MFCAGQTHLIFEHKSPLWGLRPALYAQDPYNLNQDRNMYSAHKARNVDKVTLYHTIRCVCPVFYVNPDTDKNYEMATRLT